VEQAVEYFLWLEKDWLAAAVDRLSYDYDSDLVVVVDVDEIHHKRHLDTSEESKENRAIG
jgi:hypothetical protein